MRVKKVIIGLLSVLVIALLMTPSLVAQSLVSGDLTGTITDPSGAVVPNATVTLKNSGTGQTRTTTSNNNGAYRFSLLQPGTYTVSATASGFSRAETTTNINVGQATVADVKLAVGTSSQTVEVTSAAPLVQADNADLSTNFDQNVVANAPNGGNDLTYIAQTAPGINMNTGMGYGNFNTAGLPATSNVFTTNGENQMDPYLNLNNSGATNLMLGKNAVQEATVTTNAYGGQYGQQAGAQVSYVTKSGTNAFHGNANYWWTGRAMDANTWFNGQTTPYQKTPFNNNNSWAASIGGPIKKDKLFFFADWEGIRYIVPTTQKIFSPTVAFSNATLASVAAIDPAEVPLYSKAFNLYQTATGYSSGVPQPGSCGDLSPALFSGACAQEYVGSPSLPAKEWLLTGRIDYNLSDKDHLFWSVSFDHGTQATFPDPINHNFSAASYQPQYNGQGQWTHSFGSNATNQFVYAGSYYRAIFDQINAAATFPGGLIDSPLGFTNLNPLATAFPQGRNATQYQFVDDFSVTKGAHNLKFGANFRRYDITDYSVSTGVYPEILFLSTTSFFTGTSDLFAQNYPTVQSNPVALWGIGIYAQDEWRVTKSLKLTFGLRAEHDSNPVCQTDCAADLSAPFFQQSNSPTTPYNTLVNANQHQIFRSVDSIDWAPRFGFAWSPGGSDKTVVRGGFGIFYDAFPAFLGDAFIQNFPGYFGVTQLGSAITGTFQPWADLTAANSPWVIGSTSAQQIRSGFTSGASLASLSAVNPYFAPPGFQSMPSQFHIPRYQEWSLQLEQQLDSKSSVSLAYIGNHGLHEPVSNFVNAAGAFGGLPAAPYTNNFGGVSEVTSGAVSNDNQITASYQRRLTYGFTIQASYSWAHAIDEISNGGVLGYSSTSAEWQLNPLNLRANYGNADYDIRSSFNAQYVWNTPWKFGNKWVNGAFGGWTLSQNFFARSGLPLTVFDSTTGATNYSYNPSIPSAGNGNPYLPAQVVGIGQTGCGAYLLTCLNPAGFSSVSGLTSFPNQPRNAYRGPGFFDSDFTINKNFKLTERVAFGIGANFYNVFNHPNFAEPGNLFGSPTFGQITSQTAPPTGPFGSFIAGLPANRIIQFQGKIVF